MTAVLESILEPSQVRDLINHTVHQVRRATPTGAPVQQPNSLQAIPAVQTTTPEQVMALLKQLDELGDAGVVVYPEEFEAKKKDLMDWL